MKKTLLPILFGITLVGSAFAVPSVEDRRALCERNPDNYVWVKKTQACIPVNPCASGNEDIRLSYCGHLILPFDVTNREMIIDRYVQEGLHTKVSEKLEVGEKDGYPVLGVKTNDGGYIAFIYGKRESDCYTNILYALDAYFGGIKGNIDDIYYPDNITIFKEITISKEAPREKIVDIADFASLLQNDNITFRDPDENESYTFVCPDR